MSEATTTTDRETINIIIPVDFYVGGCLVLDGRWLTRKYLGLLAVPVLKLGL